MAAFKLKKALARKIVREVEKALKAGHPPPGMCVMGSHQVAAVRMAARALGTTHGAIKSQVGTVSEPGSIEKHYGFKVRWKLYVPPPPLPPPPPEKEKEERETQQYKMGGAAHDRRIVHLEDEIRRLTNELKIAHRAAGAEQIIRDTVGEIVERQGKEFPRWLSAPPDRKRGKPTPEVPITIWSDWHLGEVINKAEVNGFNEFNFAIAEERVERLVEGTIKLCNDWHGGEYPGIIVNLIGDFVTGGIHPELKSTNEDDVIPASIKAADWIISGLTRLADVFGFVYCPCASGNHGRDTVKPEFKRYYRKNFDWLVVCMVARHFADDKRFFFDIRPSNDVHYQVWNRRFLACHGDMLGVRGGDGIIGSIGPIVRGEVKQAGQSSGLGLGFDCLVIGHWHQRLWLPRVHVNNALKGFDEFAMKALGAKPDRPTQSLWFEHPRHGKTAQWDIYLTDVKNEPGEWVSWKDQID